MLLDTILLFKNGEKKKILIPKSAGVGKVPAMVKIIRNAQISRVWRHSLLRFESGRNISCNAT